MVWIIVLHFTVGGVKAAVLPMEHRAAYTTKAECARDISTIKKRWDKQGLPSPDAVTCEKHEVAGVRNASH